MTLGDYKMRSICKSNTESKQGNERIRLRHRNLCFMIGVLHVAQAFEMGSNSFLQTTLGTALRRIMNKVCTHEAATLKNWAISPIRCFFGTVRAVWLSNRPFYVGRTIWCAVILCGSNSVGRVTAFQAVGRGFESRLPLLKFFG